MKRYKNSIIIVVCTISVLFLTEMFTEKTIQNYKKDTVGKINAVIKHKLDAEITIWGASTAFVNINPKIIQDSLRLSTFNMGIDGTNIDQYFGLLKEFLSYTKESKYLIIALDAPGGICNRDKIYNIHNWMHHFDNVNIYENMKDIDPDLARKSKYVPFYKMTMYDKHSFSFFRKSLIGNQEDYSFPNLGFENEKTEMIDTIKSQISRTVNIGKRAFNKLNEICNLAIQKGITPIVVITPCYVKGQESITNYSEITMKIQQLSKQVLTIDYSENNLSKQFNLFVDNTHLNVNGASQFSTELAQDIRKLVND